MEDASLFSQHLITGQFINPIPTGSCFTITCFHSDQMGNKGAYITLGPDMKPQFTTYEAVVNHITSLLINITSFFSHSSLIRNVNLCNMPVLYLAFYLNHRIKQFYFYNIVIYNSVYNTMIIIIIMKILWARG